MSQSKGFCKPNHPILGEQPSRFQLSRPFLLWSHDLLCSRGLASNGGGPPSRSLAAVYVSHGGPPPIPQTWPVSIWRIQNWKAFEEARLPSIFWRHISIEITKKCVSFHTWCSKSWCKSPWRLKPENTWTNTSVLIWRRAYCLASPAAANWPFPGFGPEGFSKGFCLPVGLPREPFTTHLLPGAAVVERRQWKPEVVKVHHFKIQQTLTTKTATIHGKSPHFWWKWFLKPTTWNEEGGSYSLLYVGSASMHIRCVNLLQAATHLTILYIFFKTCNRVHIYIYFVLYKTIHCVCYLNVCIYV